MGGENKEKFFHPTKDQKEEKVKSSHTLNKT